MAADCHIIGNRLNGYDQQGSKYNRSDGKCGEPRVIHQFFGVMVGEPEIRGFHPIGVYNLQEGRRGE